MRAPLVLVVLAACGAPEDSVIDRTFDPCGGIVLDTRGATAAQRASVDDAIALWRTAGVSGLRTDLDGGDVLTVIFEPAADVFHGLYDDETGVVYVNSTIKDDGERAITIAHELGHAFGLFHVEAASRVSVMNPGNLRVAPTLDDSLDVARIWGPCPLGKH